MQCKNTETFLRYTIEKDTPLQVLAMQLGYHPMQLRRANANLPSYLKRGRELRLPYRGCGNWLHYRVFAGQSLLGICRGLGLEVGEVLANNGCLPLEKLQPGQVLLLPANKQAYIRAQKIQVIAGQESAAQRLYRHKLLPELYLLLNPQHTGLILQPGQLFWAIDWTGD